MKRINSRGPKAIPCGTHDVTATDEEEVYLLFSHCYEILDPVVQFLWDPRMIEAQKMTVMWYKIKGFAKIHYDHISLALSI